MARKDENILNLLVELPWWVSVVLAATAYVFLAFILPLICAGDIFSQGLANGLSPLAPLVGLVLLTPAPFAAFNARRKRRLLDKQEHIESIRALDWKQFETLVGEAFRRQGYRVRENPGRGPDGGVDLELEKEGRRLLVQCKQWRSRKVGVKVVREMYGVMIDRRADGVIIVISGTFTPEAVSFARNKPIDLVDGRALEMLIGQVRADPRTTPRIEEDNALVCPRCGGELVLRTARRGPRAGQQFYGCSRYPDCRYARNCPAAEGTCVKEG